jgi:hypothetical protein|tara:strand:- start:636 stop:1013 length:378 start_codon:yes stop_codon:yes gene_type:complete
MLQALIGPIANLASGYLSNRHEQAQAKHQAKLQVIQNDADWESKMAAASASSWKDEFWTIVLAVPLFCLGYSIVVDDPDILIRVSDGFDVLASLPDWYQYLLFLAVSASFGIRGADKLMKLKAGK